MTVSQNTQEKRPVSTTVPEDPETTSVFEEVVPTSVTAPAELLSAANGGSTTPMVDTSALAAARTRAVALGTKRRSETLEILLNHNNGSKRRPMREASPEPLMPLPKKIASLPSLNDESKTCNTFSTPLITAIPRLRNDLGLEGVTDIRRRSVKERVVDSTLDWDSFVFVIKPIMGESFEVPLSQDSTLLDLKDAIHSHTGVIPDMQLLGMAGQGHTLFDDEEQFLADLPISSPCTLYLSVKAATGIPLVNEVSTTVDDMFFIYELATPTNELEGSETNLSPNLSVVEQTDGEEEEATVAVADDEYENNETPLDDKVSTTADSTLNIHSLKLSKHILLSYNRLLGAVDGSEGVEDGDEDNDLLFAQTKELESLRISVDAEIMPRGDFYTTKYTKSPSNSPLPTNNTVTMGPAQCTECGRKCRLAAQFKCRCGSIYCGEHRYFDRHKCTFDHKAHDRAQLDTNNPRLGRAHFSAI